MPPVWISLQAHSYFCKFTWQFNFRGIISSCFEPHLTVYVELEEKTLMESLEKLVQVIWLDSISFANRLNNSLTSFCHFHLLKLQEETWDIEEGSQTHILSSSMQVKRQY